MADGRKMELELTCHSRQAREVRDEIPAIPVLDSHLNPSLSEYSPGSRHGEGARRREETWDHLRPLDIVTERSRARVQSARTLSYRSGFGARCAQLEVFRHSSGIRSRSTGLPFTMCDSMISSTSSAVTCPYQTPSG